MSNASAAIKYIVGHPSIRDCLRLGLINHSALARLISKDKKVDSVQALIAACRRYEQKQKGKAAKDSLVRQLVRTARISTKNKISALIVEKPREFGRVLELQKRVKDKNGDFQVLEGLEAITILTNSIFVSLCRELFKGRLLKLNQDLVQITMRFTDKIESTPGVLWFLYGILAEQEVNIVEEMSCWTEVHLVVNEKDAPRAIDALSSV